MNDKASLLASLKQALNDWEEVLAGLTEDQITSLKPSSGLTIKDEVAHMMAWQQLSNARLEAALENREPAMPDWPVDEEPESDEDTDRLNAWFLETYRDKSWGEMHTAWRTGYQRLLELGKAVPESNMFDPHRHAWLAGHPISEVLIGSYEHHVEHLELLQKWLRSLDKNA